MWETGHWFFFFGLSSVGETLKSNLVVNKLLFKIKRKGEHGEQEIEAKRVITSAFAFIWQYVQNCTHVLSLIPSSSHVFLPMHFFCGQWFHQPFTQARNLKAMLYYQIGRTMFRISYPHRKKWEKKCVGVIFDFLNENFKHLIYILEFILSFVFWIILGNTGHGRDYILVIWELRALILLCWVIFSILSLILTSNYHQILLL